MDPSSIQTTGHFPSRRLWVLTVLFFFQFAAIGVYFTYLNIFYNEAGMSGSQIGIINMFAAMVGVAGMTLWGYLSDRTRAPRVVIAVTSAGTLLVSLLVPLFHTFEAFLLLAGVASLFSAGPATLIDSTALSLLGDRREDYGRYRIGGSIGYISTTLIAGALYDRVGLTAIFPVYAILMGILAGIALILPPAPPHREERNLKAVTVMMRRPAWILFTVVVLLCWIGVNASINFLGVAMKTMGASQSLVGVASTISAIFEVPFMLFSGRLIRRFGPVKLLLASMLIMILRFSLLGFMPSPIWAVPINVINGPAFVFFWNSSITYANKMAPPAMAATVQGLFSSTTSLAGVVSSLLSGWLFDLLGPTRMFLVIGAICAAALVVFTVGSAYQRQAAVEKAA